MQDEATPYQELEISELAELMSAVPLPDLPEGEKWQQPTDYQVLPMSLQQYWDAYFSDDAPYYPWAKLRDVEDIVNRQTAWRSPSPNYATINGKPSIQEKYIDRTNR